MHCPVANESDHHDHSQSKFHTASGFTMQHIVIFVIVGLLLTQVNC